MITKETVRGKHPVLPLGEVVEFLDHMRRPVKQSDRVEGPYPYYGANGLQGSIDGFIFDEPLVLMAEDGGHFDEPERGIAYQISGKSWVNNHAHVLRPTAAVDIRFLTRVLENYDIRPFISGTTRGKLTKGQAEKIEIPLPPLEEQKRIAAILDQADALCRLRARALDRLNAIGRATFQEMFGSRALKLVPLGEAVEEFRYGTSNKSGNKGLPTLRIPNVVGDEINLDDLKTVEVTEAEEKRLRLEDNDLLFVRTNGNPNYVGRCAVYSKSAINEAGYGSSWIFASYLIRARLKAGWNPYFVQTYLSSPEGRKAVRENSKTSAGQFNINTEGLASLLLPAASQADQVMFAERLAATADIKARYRSAKLHQDTLFASLQARAFGGEL